MRTIFVLFALCATFTFADIWSYCGTSKDHFTIGTVSIVPDPPQIGQNLSVVVSGTLDETVSDGSIFINLDFGPIVLLNNTYDLCKMLGTLGISCPLEQGAVKLGVKELIPKQAPPGAYTGKVILSDQNGQELTCIGLAFSLGSDEPEIKPEPINEEFKRKIRPARSAPRRSQASVL